MAGAKRGARVAAAVAIEGRGVRGTIVRVLLCGVFLCGLVTDAGASTMGEDCDWFGSGLSGPERGVSPVYLRCAQGRVEWAYPRGALRVLLRLGGAGADFRACVRLDASAAGARLFLEGPRRLAPLFADAADADADAADAADAGHPRPRARCFRSKRGVAAVYVESTPAGGGDFAKRTAAFSYDLEPLPRGASGYDPADQCRPCSREEMARAFCTSDVVARGFISGVRDRPELEVTELSVSVTKLLRRSTPVDAFDGPNAAGFTADAATPAPCDNAVDCGAEALAVQIPLHCGARHGAGEFVFMARRKLGELALTCAPRVKDWTAAVHALQASGAAHCVLAS